MRLFLLLFIGLQLFGEVYDLEERIDSKLVLKTKQIVLPGFPEAFNPSIIEHGEGYLLVFRHCPNAYWDPWLNYIGVVPLSADFEPVSEPQILSPRLSETCVKSQAEDPRVLSYQGRLYVIYNDNIEVSRPWYRDRRDMFIAELTEKDGRFALVGPTKLVYERHYHATYWQKNWAPFEWNGKLFLTYSISPHEINFPNLSDGACYPCYETEGKLGWRLGLLRGSAQARLVDGEYLSFFHSGHQLTTSVSRDEPRWHYFMGAYTFAPEPPFEITKISKEPIVGEGFYGPFGRDKNVILPGGFVVKGSRIFVAYGKDDVTMWVAELDKEVLIASLVPVKPS